MKTRREIRESIFKILFQLDNNDLSLDTIIDLEDEDTKKDEFFINTINSIFNKKEEIDEIINNNLTGWTIKRLSKMDRQILRISTYEIINTDIPYKVSINEAVELSKKYSEKNDSYKFINGVLKGIVQKVAK